MLYLRSMLLLLGFFAAPSGAADPPKSTPEQRLIFARQTAADYRFQLADERAEARLHPEPLLRWNNQVIREDDGMLFLWTKGENGQPVATAQFFLQSPDWHHEFQSLSPGGFDARFVGEGGRGWSWRPNRPGVRFTTAEEIDRPADTASQRLRQMKSIAERFTAAVDSTAGDEFESPEQLRLLARPLYRYAAQDDGILDGAMFAFVQGTNPEVLLLIEARQAGQTAAWRYGFARMSCFKLRVKQGDDVVWSGEREAVPTPDVNWPYHFRYKAQPDR